MRIKKIIYTAIAIIALLFLIFEFNFSSSKDIIKSGKSITMFIASDSHYLDKSLTDNSQGYEEYAITRDGKQLLYMEEIMDAFANDIKVSKPDILIMSGDLTNNGEMTNHIELAKRFKKIEKSGTSVYVIPGNHDILSIWARGYRDGSPYQVENVDHNEFKEIYKDFGYKEAISQDNKTLSYLATPSEDIWLLMIDSNKYFSDYSMPSNSGIITEETIDWIKECSRLAKEKNAKLLAVMHHPLMQHSLKVADGTLIDNSSEVTDLFKELDIEITFSGHIHIQDIKADDVENPKIYDIVNSALSVYPQQYGVLKYSLNDGYDYSNARVNVEQWANQQRLSDPNLLSFNEYSKNSFGSRPYNTAVEELRELETYSDQEIEDIAQMVKDLNLRQFEGTIYSIKEELFSSALYKKFIETESEYLYDFVYRMVHSVDMDSSKLKIKKDSSFHSE